MAIDRSAAVGRTFMCRWSWSQCCISCWYQNRAFAKAFCFRELAYCGQCGFVKDDCVQWWWFYNDNLHAYDGYYATLYWKCFTSSKILYSVRRFAYVYSEKAYLLQIVTVYFFSNKTNGRSVNKFTKYGSSTTTKLHDTAIIMCQRQKNIWSILNAHQTQRHLMICEILESRELFMCCIARTRPVQIAFAHLRSRQLNRFDSSAMHIDLNHKLIEWYYDALKCSDFNAHFVKCF